MSIEPCFLNSLYESNQIISPFEIVLKTITKNREQSTIFREKLAEEKPEQKQITGCSGNKDGENVKYIARSRLMDVPENVGLNHIQASIFRLLYQILPHLHAAHIRRKLQTNPKHISTKTHKNREMWRLVYLRSASWVMYRTRKENSPLAVDHHGLPIVGHATPGQLGSQTQ